MPDTNSTGVTKESSGSSPEKIMASVVKPKVSNLTKSKVTPPTQAKEVKERDDISKVRAVLEATNRVTFLQERPRSFPRTQALKLESILDGLIPIYTDLFQTNWSHFNRLTAMAPGDTIEQAAGRLASSYLCGWINDLYACNRKACETGDPVIYRDYYLAETSLYSEQYDIFLANLANMIKPVTILGTAEETLFVPTFGKNLFESRENPFNLRHGWRLISSEFHGVISILINKKEFKCGRMKFGGGNGRAIWLLDFWHDDTVVNAWFPKEGNYSADDIVSAILVGKPITEVMAPSDNDNWQVHTHASERQTDAQLPRLNARSIYGAHEERVVNHFEMRLPSINGKITSIVDIDPMSVTYAAVSPKKGKGAASGSKKRPRAAADPNEDPTTGLVQDEKVETLNGYQISDFVYYALVAQKFTRLDRFRSLKQIVCTGHT
uniref:Coat protein n=1 Tax=Tree fringewort deltapartitivirus TaxID=2933096 RepID=A0A9C7GWP3_9VIRU|nr:putative coat protein [Tree fringewort deltapartitivirus]CAI5384006.1 putative coat protein [Tree fringewort deltapartitivirus]